MAVNKRLLQGPTGGGGFTPSENFKAVLYTGNGGTQSITGVGFKPDFVWVKERSAAESHRLFDSTRGATKRLFSDNTNAESTATDSLTSFDTDGFSLGSSAGINESGQTYVAWCWKAGEGTTSSNTDGSITSTVQANTDSGFSIVKYTGNQISQATVGHGLGITPKMVIVKEIDSNSGWIIYHSTLGNTKHLLFTSGAVTTSSDAWANTSPTSSTVTLGNNSYTNQSGINYIMYCFADIDSFSKFGSYTGNGSDNGTIVETGFEPAFLMIKQTDDAANWCMVDNKRSTTNPRDKGLRANSNASEPAVSTNLVVDFLSNGFQLKQSGGNNVNNGNFIYMAFAADPDTEAPTLASSFNAIGYSGNNSSNRTISGMGFQPDLLWIKSRTSSEQHYLWDSIRGSSKFLHSNMTAAEGTDATTRLKEFLPDGFKLGNELSVNGNNETYISWAWKADDNEATIEEVTEDADAVAIYELNQNANDALGNYNGTVTGTANWTSSGKFNYAAEFDSWHINTGHNFSLANNSFSISFWFANSATGSTNSYVISTDSAESTNNKLIIGRRDSNGKLNFAFYANDLSSATDVTTDGTWQHWVCTYNASTNSRKIYLNGSLDASDTASADYQGTGNLEIGFGIYQGLGKVDQVRIYNKELNTASVINLYNETTSQTSTANIGTKTTISSQSIVSANANAGFSIVKWTGTGSAAKVPHGLSAAPEMIITKRLNGAGDWYTYHKDLNSGTNPAYNFIKLNSSDAEIVNASSGGSIWNSTSPTATVINVGTTLSGSTSDSYIAYAFHSVSGYSKIGSYTRKWKHTKYYRIRFST